jgi:hypothetical protein
LLSRTGKASSVFTPETLSKILQTPGSCPFKHRRQAILIVKRQTHAINQIHGDIAKTGTFAPTAASIGGVTSIAPL